MKDKEAVKIIKYNRKCAKTIRRWIKKEKDSKKRMDLIECYLFFCSNNITGIYSDSWVERKIIEYSEQIDFSMNEKIEKNTALMVMTMAAPTGGHTALVNNWINFDQSRKYSIVLTDCPEGLVPEFLKESVRKTGGDIIFLNQKGYINKAKALLEISKDYEKIFLHIHMYDMVPVIAYGHKNWSRPVFFYNHADFLFSIGMSVSDLVLTLNQYDKRRAKKNRGAHKAEVLPYPHDREFYRKPKEDTKVLKNRIGQLYGFDSNCKIILTVALDFKLMKTEHYDFKAFVEQVIHELPDNTFFYIIGANPDNTRWIEMTEKTNGHARALGVLERDTLSDWIQISDAYVTSFPMPAAGASEANEYNIPVFYFSPIARSNEFFPSNAVFSSVNDMKNAVIECVKEGKKEKYELTPIYKLSMDRKEWCNLLDNLLASVKRHHSYSFRSIPIIGTQEIINVQLLQEDHESNNNEKKLDEEKVQELEMMKRKKDQMYADYNGQHIYENDEGQIHIKKEFLE